jgi:hypothetical protein
MITQDLIALFPTIAQDPPVSLQQQYARQRACFSSQPPPVQRTLETQARLVARGIAQRLSPIYFVLPEQIACQVDGNAHMQLQAIPAGQRQQKMGDLLGQLDISDIDRHLKALETDENRAISTGAALIRYLIARKLVESVLPANRDEWDVFDENSNLLVNSIDEAREKIFAMRHALDILVDAVKLTPYLIADKDFQWKRYGVQGQMLGQGRALAHYEIGEIIRTIRKRADAHALNRGFSLSLPYFDDQDLEMKTHTFEVIPVGRVGFDPLFIVWAARYQQSDLSKQKKMSPSTCNHLTDLLKTLEQAFVKPVRSTQGH